MPIMEAAGLIFLTLNNLFCVMSWCEIQPASCQARIAREWMKIDTKNSCYAISKARKDNCKRYWNARETTF